MASSDLISDALPPALLAKLYYLLAKEFEPVYSDCFSLLSIYALIKIEKYLNKIRPCSLATLLTLQHNDEHNEDKAFLVYITSCMTNENHQNSN